MNEIIIKILDYEIWIYKNNILYKEKTKKIIENNFIVNNKILLESLKNIIKKYKLKNNIFQNKVYIMINKLYCETNFLVLKDTMLNLGFSNYNFIYEEEIAKKLFSDIILVWNNNGIIIIDDKEYYFDLKNRKNLKNLKGKTLLITSNDTIIDQILEENNDIIIYENRVDPLFKLIKNTN